MAASGPLATAFSARRSPSGVGGTGNPRWHVSQVTCARECVVFVNVLPIPSLIVRTRRIISRAFFFSSLSSLAQSIVCMLSPMWQWSHPTPRLSAKRCMMSPSCWREMSFGRICRFLGPSCPPCAPAGRGVPAAGGAACAPSPTIDNGTQTTAADTHSIPDDRPTARTRCLLDRHLHQRQVGVDQLFYVRGLYLSGGRQTARGQRPEARGQRPEARGQRLEALALSPEP